MVPHLRQLPKEGSPADTSGLMVGDILVGFGGKQVSGHEELLELLGPESAGSESGAEILRGGALKKVPVRVGSAL